MSANEGNPNSATGGASNSVPWNSIIDAYVFGTIFPCNYWRTLNELTQLYAKREHDKNDMIKLKLLAVLLTEQLCGQLTVDLDKTLDLMDEYRKVRGE